jgi:hypothetical protein
MKRHKQFRMAISVSIQERRDLFPELTDSDVVKALKITAEEMAKAAWDRKRQEDLERFRQTELQRRWRTPQDIAAELQHSEEARRIRKQAEAEQRAAAAQRWAAEAAERERRIQEQQKLREEIVRTGHKLLAKKHHPDAGGSTEHMVKLNRARDSLLPPHPSLSSRGQWK